MTGRPAVAVTGLGVRCAAGSTPDELWDSLLHGRSAVSLHSFDAEGTVVATPDRATLVAVQTPQAFRADVLRKAHASGSDGTDDAALVEAIGCRVVTVAGEPTNRKITDRADLEWAAGQIGVGG